MIAAPAPALRARVSLFVLTVALLVMVPVSAFAAGATFSAKAPRSSAAISPSRAAVSVSVYESHGVRGSSSYSMSVDGVKVRASIVYSRPGDYRRFRVTFKPSRAWRAGAHTVLVKVRDRRGNTSTTRWTFTVKASTVEAVTPLMAFAIASPSPTGSDLQPSYLGTATIVLDPPVGGRSFFCLDGGPVQAGTTVVVAPPAAGFVVYTLTYMLVDAAGNAGQPMSATFIVEAPALVAADTTAPTTVSDPEWASGAGIDLWLVASDDTPGPVTTYWRIAGADDFHEGTLVDLPAPTGYGYSTTMVEYWSVDSAGNEELPHHTESVIRFVQPPVVPDSAPPVTTSNAVGAYAGTATVAFSATDDSDDAVVTLWSLDGGPLGTGTTVVVAAPAEPEEAGYHTIVFWSVDAAGNEEAHKSVTFLVEYDAPIIIDPPSHTVTGSCISIPDCHPSDARSIHRLTGCLACHENGRPLTWECSSCHVEDPCLGTHDWMRPQTWSDAQMFYEGDATIRIWSMDRSPLPIAQVLGSGVAVTYVRLDGGDPVAYTDLSNYIVLNVEAPPAGAELHRIEFWSVDTSGNEEFPHNWAEFSVDAGRIVDPRQHLASGACVEGGCHQTDVSQIHTAQGCATCHEAGTAPTTVCSPCHSEGACPASRDLIPPQTWSDVKAAYIGEATIKIWSMDRSPFPIAQVLGSGVAATYVSVDGAAPVEHTSLGDYIIIKVPAPASGSVDHTIEFWSADEAGNVEAPHNVAAFKVEANPPVSIPGSGLVPDGVEGGFARLRIVPPIGVPSTAVYFRLDGGATRAGTVVLIPLPVSDSVSHSVSYWWADASGNVQAPRTQAITLTPDYTGEVPGPV